MTLSHRLEYWMLVAALGLALLGAGCGHTRIPLPEGGNVTVSESATTSPTPLTHSIQLDQPSMIERAIKFHATTVYAAQYPSYRGCSFVESTSEYVVSFTDPSASKGVKYYFNPQGLFREVLLVGQWY